MKTKNERLESLIKEYEVAIANRDQKEINRLVALVEREADRIGYDNHRRLAALHTAAERAGQPGDTNAS